MKSIHKRLIIAVFCSLLFTGCSALSNTSSDSDQTSSKESATQEQTAVEQTTQEQITQEQTTDPEVEMNINYAEVASIQIVDISDDMYEEKLQYDLTSEQVDGFIASIDDLTLSNKKSGNKGCYKLNMYDKDGNLIDVWKVNILKYITNNKGETYKSDSIKTWLKSVEGTFNISLESIFSRKPAKNYFSLMSEASFGKIHELTENNFQESLDIDLNEKDINEMTSSLQNVEFSGTASNNIKKKYTIDVFNENGATLYILYADENLKIYNDFGYEISGGNIKEWLEKLINGN